MRRRSQKLGPIRWVIVPLDAVTLPSRRRTAVVATIAVAAIAGLLRVPLASAAFTKTTGNGGNAFAAADSFCPTPGSATRAVTNDTMVSQSAPATNYGGVLRINVASRSGANQRVIVRPTLPAIPARCTVTSAVLRFTVLTYGAGRTYQAFALASNWDVNTVTWNTQPATTGAAATATTSSPTFSIDVTGPIRASYAAGTNFGILVRDRTEGDATTVTNTFDTVSGTNPGVVTVTWG